MPQQVAIRAGVAELARMRARIGKPDHRTLAVEQRDYLVFLVVEQGDAEARLEFALQPDVEHQVDWIDAALACEFGEIAFLKFGAARVIRHPTALPAVGEA